MRRSVAVLIAVAVVFSVFSMALAQSERQGVPVQLAQAKHLEAKIQSVDPAGKMVTLSDGTMLVIPDNLAVNREALKPGAVVRAAYEEKGGEKVATQLEVQAEKK